jgi:hypothetical protein
LLRFSRPGGRTLDPGRVPGWGAGRRASGSDNSSLTAGSKVWVGIGDYVPDGYLPGDGVAIQERSPIGSPLPAGGILGKRYRLPRSDEAHVGGSGQVVPR